MLTTNPSLRLERHEPAGHRGDDGLAPESTSEAAAAITSTAEINNTLAGGVTENVKLFCWCTPVDAVFGIRHATICKKHPVNK